MRMLVRDLNVPADLSEKVDSSTALAVIPVQKLPQVSKIKKEAKKGTSKLYSAAHIQLYSTSPYSEMIFLDSKEFL
jgi:hypothetical protein